MDLTFRIRNWDTHFENNRSKELKNPAWVPMPNSHDGDGYTELVDHPNGAAHFGAWCALVQIASRCGERGTFMRDTGKPHNSRSLSRMSRIPATVFDEVIPRLLEIQWLETVNGIPHEGAAPDRMKVPRTEQNRTEQEENTGDAREVFEDYRARWGKVRPPDGKDMLLSAERRRKIQTRLKDCGKDTILEAHKRAFSGRGWGSKNFIAKNAYRGPGWFCRNQEYILQWAGYVPDQDGKLPAPLPDGALSLTPGGYYLYPCDVCGTPKKAEDNCAKCAGGRGN